MSKKTMRPTGHDDVVVMFPGMKTLRTVEEVKNPTKYVEEDFKKSLDIKGRLDTSSTQSIQTLSDVTDSLEVRLNVLNEINDRLKFYLDDLELNLKK